MIAFKSVGHFFAKAFQAIGKGLLAVEAEKPIVEGVTAAAGQTALVPFEDAAFALLGAVSAALTAGGAAAAQKLQDAGLDVVAIQKAQDVLKAVPQVVAVAKSL
jgi:hypothetical protein